MARKVKGYIAVIMCLLILGAGQIHADEYKERIYIKDGVLYMQLSNGITVWRYADQLYECLNPSLSVFSQPNPKEEEDEKKCPEVNVEENGYGHGYVCGPVYHLPNCPKRSR